MMDKIEKILERMTQMDYTAEHGKVSKDYAYAYHDALEWVLDVIFDFQMPIGVADDPAYRGSKESTIYTINTKDNNT